MPTSRAIQTVKVEIVPPADQAPRRNPLDVLKELVERQVAEILADRDSFAFQPFLNSRQVSYEIRRLQTMPERRAWMVVFAEHGCLYCKRKDLVYFSYGFCAGCYARILKWKQEAARQESENSPPESRPCDLEALARAALTPSRKALPPATNDCKPKRSRRK
jgi:hypothetical protein